MRRASRARQIDDHDRDAMLAWQIERVSIMAQKKDGRELPTLKKVLQRGPEKPQTPDDQAAVLLEIARIYNLPVRTTKATHGRSHT